MNIDVDKYFSLFMKELENDSTMSHYYKFLTDKKKYLFRKNYFTQRLNYIVENIGRQDNSVWDCGCGYGTTAIFLALNGFKVHGSTIGVYFDYIPRRLGYWSEYGDISSFTYEYETIFDFKDKSEQFDRIIVQDALHHIEPVEDTLKLIHQLLKDDGKVLAIEENGRNILQWMKEFLLRGNKKIVERYDERLKRSFKFGHENIRSLNTWQKIFDKENFNVDDYEFIRLYPPFLWDEKNYLNLQKKENNLWRKNKLLADFMYYGINFSLSKNIISNI